MLANIVWIVFLSTALYKDSLQGPKFILDGVGAGYVATFFKFYISQLVMSIGQIMPYRSMASDDNPEWKRTMGADYWPYEWPIARIRILLNHHYFLFFVDLFSFLSTFVVVQFESNILSTVYNDEGSPEYTPNKGVIYIAISCHAIFLLIIISTLIWSGWKDTGLLAAPGSIAMYLAMVEKSDLDDYNDGLEVEDRQWVVRDRLGRNLYRIKYWENSVYGIRKICDPPNSGIGINPRLSIYYHNPYILGHNRTSTLSKNQLPRFNYIPWFLRPSTIAVFAGLLTAALSIALTLLVNDNILQNGFNPRVSTKLLPIVDISPAAFLWSFLPSLAADQYRLLVKSIDMFYRLVQPYADLKRKDTEAEHVRNCFIINYTNDLPIVITLKALKNRHWKVAFVSVFSLISSFITSAAANMFYLDFDGDFNERIFIWKDSFFPVVGYMGALIIVLIILIPDDTRYMPHDLETISDHISFLAQSSLLDHGKYQYKPEGDKPMSRNDKGDEVMSRTNKGNNAKSRTDKRDKAMSRTERLKQFTKQAWKEANPWFVSKPVEDVVRKLRASENDGAPRFGIWKTGNSFAICIDIDRGENLISAYDEDYYEWNIWKRAKEEFL